ncbi:carbohydrate esterase family 4 protein [Macrolepiota fuliginosa MF-IS2]|uniref:chitin deacetylase n=1 Tax=Macrolepiota fuliginosa MF-IS2 TaxID=1400762 RepID=A0A9P5XKJ2_9AGAR|nr:carbohydrate esterase family 4 protein [Macrolepiota fuliginosa MF-IS2]
MRFALAAAAVAIPLVSACADPAQHARRMNYERQAAPSPSTTPAAPPAGTSAVGAASSSSGPAPAGSQAPSGVVPPGQTTPLAPAPAATSFSFSLLATNPTAVPLSNIVATALSATTRPLDSTAAPGSVPTFIPGAPALPNAALLNPANYPALDKVPPIDSPEVQQWIQEVQNSGFTIPGLNATLAGGCPANAAFAADTSRCWWTCGGCTRESDITECPTAKHWGLTYDDGPAFYTSDLLHFLDEKQLKSTFFVVGSRVISFPAILQDEYMDQHQIAVHTWSHPPLTTLSNEEIIAELGWSKKVIKDVLGVTPNMMRPPFGDIDDRVRAISLAMGLTPVMWTRISPSATFDTDDFNIHGGLTSVGQVLQNWQNILGNVSTRDSGFIVLEHDLFQQTVEVATGYILPDAIARGLTIEPVYSCLSRPLANAYIETNDNSTNPPPTGSGAAAVLSAPPTTNSDGTGVGAAGPQSTTTKGSSGGIETFRHGTTGAVLAAFASLFALL